MRNARRGATDGVAVNNVSIASLHRESDRLRGEKTALEARVEELETIIGGNISKHNHNADLERLKMMAKTLREENEHLRRKLLVEETKKGQDRGKVGITQTKPLSLLDAVEAVDNNNNDINSDIGTPDDTVKDLRQRLHDSEVARKAIESLLLDAKIKEENKENRNSEGNNNIENNKMSSSSSKRLEELQNLLVQSKDSFNKLFQENAELQAQLADAKTQLMVPQTPTMLHHQSLLRRIEQMEYRHNNRERELERIVQQVKQRAELDIQLARANFQNVLTQKNAEIKRFQIELDSLMEDVKRIL